MTAQAAPLRVLFVIRSLGFLRNFEHAVAELLRRGHGVTILVEQAQGSDARYAPVLAALREAGARIADERHRPREPAHRVAVAVRHGLDMLRYLEPAYDATPKVRARAAAQTPAPLRYAGRLVRDSPARRARLRGALTAADAAAPVSGRVRQALAEHRPDVLLLTPLVELGAPQADWVRAARAAGVPSALGVASWDNLTVKGALRVHPDLVLVWNASQVAEAVELHGVAPERVLATGAHTYDHWFAWRPSRDRDAFCREVGLRADRPFLVYLCSSPFIAPGEAAFVREWIAALRGSPDPVLREAGVLVRPHPQHLRQWQDTGVADLGDAVLWPAAGGDPVERRSREDYFDTLFHGAAVVGINTSAQIEAAIVDREVLTVLDERFAATQGGTRHFGHLADAAAGVLTVARDMAEHHVHLAAALRGGGEAAERRRRFVTSFVRPFGLDVPGAPRVADALEALAARGTAAAGAPAPAPVSIRAGWRVAAVAGHALPVLDPRSRRRLGERIGHAVRRRSPVSIGRVDVRDLLDGSIPVARRRVRRETPLRDFWRP